MKIPRDRELPRRKENADVRPKETDFDFRQARDAPVSADELRQRKKDRIPQSEAVQPDIAKSVTEEEPVRAASDTEKPRHTLHQHGNEYQQRFQEAAKAEEQPVVRPEEPHKPSKLNFTADELPPDASGKKLVQAQKKVERTADKLERAEQRLPSYRKLRMETSSDPDTGKVKKRPKFEKQAKPQIEHVKGAFPLRPVKAGAAMAGVYAHRKLYQSEHENIGLEAAHRTEMAAEGGARVIYRQFKTAPYRKVSRLQRKAVKAKANAAYQQALHDNPQLKKKMLARIWQKQKLKRQYAKAAREAQKAGKRAKNTAVTTEKIAVCVVQSIKNHPVVWGVAALLLLTFYLITSVFTSVSGVGAGGLGGIAASTYLADDRDIDNAELFYTEWETDLELQIKNAETDHPGYDEYVYQIDAIGHDPYALIAYLTAVYQDFSFSQVENDLRQLFEQQYTLTFTEETETRCRTEGETEVPYEWHILNIRLTAQSFNELIVSKMTAEQREICEALLQIKGNRQYVRNVLGFNWLGYVSSYYGYRVHPISEVKNYHTGVDIGVPEGTEIIAGHDGKVTLAGDAGGYGLCVALEGEAYGGHTLTTKYGHCSQILVSVGQEVKAGDVIAKVGSTGNSTGPHLHLELLIDGQYLNPLYFADTGDTNGFPLN